ncbi:hypothetical protein Tco_0702017 [Tanacetum coccineum]|uniref:Uncharacterized protein n=1 Tax=Tanacetum coccineum TaxID=301880 RepID=A0ABQ4XVG0_9ASTR
MELENTQNNALAKLPMLKLREYEMWEIRIKQYFQIQDYALWRVLGELKFLGLGSTSGIRACALRNFDLEVMKFKSAQSNTTTKLPILKLVNTVMLKECLLLLKHDLEALEDFWMNKADIEIMSIDDLYNNFKIVEQDVKKYVGASTGAQNMTFMTAPSTSSTNDVNTAKPAYEVSTVSPHVNTTSPQVSTANFSDNVVYAFMVENPNGFNLLQQDLEQIHEDDLEAVDLKW